MVAISVYMVHSVKLTGENLELLSELQQFILCLQEPFVIGADWNMEASTLEESWWPRAVVGVVVAPQDPTCGNCIYDFFVISAALAGLSPKASAVLQATTYPHVPVRLTFDKLGSQSLVWVQKGPKHFDSESP